MDKKPLKNKNAASSLGSIVIHSKELIATDNEKIPWPTRKKLKVKSNFDQYSEAIRHKQTATWLKPFRKIHRKTKVEKINDEDLKSSLNNLLTNEQNYTENVEDFVEYDHCVNNRKKELLHENWEKHVYFPLQSEVKRTMERDYRTMLSKRMELFSSYLDLQNKKRDLFLDMQILHYDPYKCSRMCLPACRHSQYKSFQDPLFVFDRKKSEENKILFSCNDKTSGCESFPRKHPPLLPYKSFQLVRGGRKCVTRLPRSFFQTNAQSKSRHITFCL